MKRFHYALLVFLFLSACSRPSPSTGELDDARDLAAVLDGEMGRLYVREGMTDQVLKTLEAKKTGDVYAATISRTTLSFSVVPTPTPQVYAPDIFGSVNINAAFFAKIYFNAQCGQFHNGFVSPCVQTFGPHKAFGNSMIWQVNNWHSCARGDSLCVEVLKQVGTITYYPDFSCSDTMFVTRPIMRFSCD